MKIKELWVFPVPSAGGLASDVKLIHPDIYNDKADAMLLFDYYVKSLSDATGTDEVFSSGVSFRASQAYRHSCDMFVTCFDAYDTLIEIEDSEWVAEMRQINREIADYWDIKHYAIFLDSNGLYEFIARGFKILEPKKMEFN